ncbi:MAG: beta-ketoacyl synthase chain length factor [Bacteroidales bacterium]
MSYYLNCIKSHTEVIRDLKELIPDMNIRRRMSPLIKTAVATGMEVLADFGERCPIDAIVTASRLGCITDSEKFLSNIIDNNEQMLNPTPFIQSTFNTVGAQIALLKGLHCYNMTYSHREISLESALLDAMIRLDNKSSQAVLIGVFDEITPTVRTILARMQIPEHEHGATFFVVTADRYDSSLAELLNLSFDSNKTAQEGLTTPSRCNAAIVTTYGNTAFMLKEVLLGNTPANPSFLHKNNITMINQNGSKTHSVIQLKCI